MSRAVPFLAALAVAVGATACSAPARTSPPPASATSAPAAGPTEPRAHVSAERKQGAVASRTGTGHRSDRVTDRRTTYRPGGRVARPPRVHARAWAVADLETGRVLAAHHARRHLPMASTIKLLTALTAVRRVPADVRHKATRREAHPDSCTCVGVRAGRRYTRQALMAGMLLVSGNDAAETLAGADPEGRRAFVAAMNARARELGADDTRAANPSGLTERGSWSSARDLLVLLRAAEATPAIERVLGRSAAEFGPVHGRSYLVGQRTGYVRAFPRSQGKSGYTTAARNTLVVSSRIEVGGGRERRLGVATLGAPGSASTRDTRALLVWVARHHAQLRPLGRLPQPPSR